MPYTTHFTALHTQILSIINQCTVIEWETLFKLNILLWLYILKEKISLIKQFLSTSLKQRWLYNIYWPTLYHFILSLGNVSNVCSFGETCRLSSAILMAKVLRQYSHGEKSYWSTVTLSHTHQLFSKSWSMWWWHTEHEWLMLLLSHPLGWICRGLKCIMQSRHPFYSTSLESPAFHEYTFQTIQAKIEY